MLTRAHIVGCFLAVASLHCGAQTAYSEGDFGATGRILYKYNLTARTAVAVGSGPGTVGGAPIEPIVGLTFRKDQRLYAVGTPFGSSTALLLTLSTLNGQATVIGTLAGITPEQASQASLAFDCDDTLWMSSTQGNQLWKVNPDTAAAQLVGNIGAQVTGIAARNGVLYGAGGAVDKIGPNPNFYTIDTATGRATVVGNYGVTNWVGAVSPAFDASGQLWGLIGSFPTQSGGAPADWSSLARIADGGAMTLLGSITSSSAPALKSYTMSGLAIAPPVCTSTGGGTGGGPTVSNPTAPTLSPIGWVLLVLGLIATAALGMPGRLRDNTGS